MDCLYCNYIAASGNARVCGWYLHEGKKVYVHNGGINFKCPVEIPTIVCLCGSTKFKDAYEKAMRDETLKGNIVLTVGLFGHQEGLDMDGPTKKMLDELHLRKIDVADEVLFLNVDGYIGESTRKELAYTKLHNISIRYLEPVFEEE